MANEEQEPKLVKLAGLAIAEQVFAQVKEMFAGDKDQPYIFVTGFYNYKCTGYHFAADGRAVTVINNPISDQIRLVFGESAQFNHDTRHAKDGVGVVDLAYNDYQGAAKVVVDYLVEGIPPKQSTPHRPATPRHRASWDDMVVSEPGIQVSLPERLRSNPFEFDNKLLGLCADPGIVNWPYPVMKAPTIGMGVDALEVFRRTAKERLPLTLPGFHYSLNGASAESTTSMLNDAGILLQEVPGGVEQIKAPLIKLARNIHSRRQRERKFKRLAHLLQVVNPLTSLAQLEWELKHFANHDVPVERITGLAELIQARHHREFIVDRARKNVQDLMGQGGTVYKSGAAKVHDGGEVEIQLLYSRDCMAVHCPDFPTQTRYFRTFSGASSFFYFLVNKGFYKTQAYAILYGSLTPFKAH